LKHRAAERGERTVEELPQLEALVAVELARIGDVPERRHHQVPVRVRVEVQEHVRLLAAVDDQVRVVVAGGLVAEDAPGLLRALLDVLQPPRRPQPADYNHLL
jgi:hypothetical protein